MNRSDKFHVEDHLSNFNKAFYTENNIFVSFFGFFESTLVCIDGSHHVFFCGSPLFICE